MRSLLRPACLALASVLASWIAAPLAVAAEADAPERPFVKHFPGAKVVKRSTRAFDEYWLALGRLRGDGQAEQAQMLEGRWTHATLTNPEGRSVAEIMKHYEERLGGAGFEILYACKDVDCGEGGRRTNGDWWPLTDTRRYVVARLSRPAQGDVWVSVHVHARKPNVPGQHEVDIVEGKAPAEPPRPRDEADVATLAKELRANGRVVLHSLGFVDGRPTVLPESEPVVKAIAELLTRDPGMKFHVVVHCDATGASTTSLELTKKRATAVATLLTRRHGVAAARVRPAGVGPLAPMATNDTEEGRALNRRVELVPQTPGRGREAAAEVGDR